MLTRSVSRKASPSDPLTSSATAAIALLERAYSTVADAESLNSVLLVLSCGSEWGGAELGHEGNPEVPET